MVYPPAANLHIGLHDDEKARESSRYLRGDVVDVFPMSQILAPSPLTIRTNGTGPGRMRWLRITGVPAPLAQIKEKLMADWTQEEYTTSGLTLKQLGRKRWKGDAPEMAIRHPAKYAELRDTGWTTVTWAQVKNFLRKEDGSLVTDVDLS